MTGPRLTPLIDALPLNVPFTGPEIQERQFGRPFKVRIGANENVFGPSPKAIRAMQDAVADCWMYGDTESHDLRSALAAHLGVDMENLIIGAGIDGLLGSLVRMTVAPGDKVVTSLGGYPTFNYHVTGYGGELVQVPYQDDHEHPAALLAKAAEVNAKLVYIANPDNPMASWHSADVINEMIANVPEGCLMILDEAYIEFAPEGTAPQMQVDNPNLIRMRTFSKAYAMAGARVGYGIGHADLIGQFSKVRDHFGMSRTSQIGALAALQDQDYLQQVIDKVSAARQRIGDIARENGLTPLPSATNFVTIDCGRDGDFARAIVEALGPLGVFIRMPFAAPQNRCIRISAGTEQHLDALADALPQALAQAKRRLG